MKYTQGIYIDGTHFDVPFVSINRSFDVLDKYAERDEENGDLKREVLGVYCNYTLNFGVINDDDLYESLIDKLTEPIDFHEFSIPSTKNNFSFKGYISQVKDEVMMIQEETVKFQNLSCKFTMKKPFRAP